MPDPARASQLLYPYQIVAVDDLAVAGTYPNAREVRIDTNLASGASDLAVTLQNLLGEKAQRFSVAIGKHDLKLSSFEGSPPAYTGEFGRIATEGQTLLPARVSMRLNGSDATLEVRG